MFDKESSTVFFEVQTQVRAWGPARAWPAAAWLVVYAWSSWDQLNIYKTLLSCICPCLYA